MCAFAGTCESPIENGQETDKFPGTPTNLPTHVYHPAMDSTLWLMFTTVSCSSGTQLYVWVTNRKFFLKIRGLYLVKKINLTNYYRSHFCSITFSGFKFGQGNVVLLRLSSDHKFVYWAYCHSQFELFPLVLLLTNNLVMWMPIFIWKI